MSRVKTSLDHKRIRRLVWLVLTVFVLFCYSLQNVAGSTYYSMLVESYGIVSSSPVILQSGTTGTSTIYTNNTSAKVSVSVPKANNTENYVDINTSDIDNSTDKGTHSNFTAQQYGPDSIYDTLTEGHTHTLELWVNGFTNLENDWAEVGASPYLDAIDYATNYIWVVSTDLDYESQFDFANSSDLGTVDDVKICLYTVNEAGGDDEIEVYLYNSTGGPYSIVQFAPTAGSWGWYNYSCLSTLPTWTEVNNGQLRVRAEEITGGNDVYVDGALLLINYTSLAVKNWGTITPTPTYSYTNYRYMGGTSPNADNMTVTKLHIRYSGTGTVAMALYTGGTLTDPTGATKRTEVYNVSVSAGWNEIDVPDYDWEKNAVTWIGLCHSGGSIYSSPSSADAGDFQTARGRWSQTTPSDANETGPMPTSPGSGSFGNYWYAMYVEFEASNFELDLEVQWTNVDFDEANEELAIYFDERNTHSLDATGGYMIIGDGTPDWGSATGTISFWVKMDGSVQGRFWGQDTNMETRWSGTNLTLDWGGTNSMTSATTFSADTWYFVAIVWNETSNDLFLYIGNENNPPTLDSNSLTGTWTGTTPAPTENRFLNGLGGDQPVYGHGDDLRYWNTTRTLAEIQSDYDVELTGSEANLRSYFKLNNNFDDIGSDNNDGAGSGSYSFFSDVAFEAPPPENLGIDVWNGSTWQNLFTNLTNGWNNASVSSYLTSSNFTIRFQGTNETDDIYQDSWNMDATILHTWTSLETTYDHVLRVNNTETDSWQIRLKKFADTNIDRLQNCTIYFRNSTDGTLSQVVIENGLFIDETGPWYDLDNSETIYIAMTVQANSTGTSYVRTYLEILIPNTSTYAQYIITFEIT